MLLEAGAQLLPGAEQAQLRADLRLLPRSLVLQLNLKDNRNVSLGSGYRAYPGYSAAQVRKQLGIGW